MYCRAVFLSLCTLCSISAAGRLPTFLSAASAAKLLRAQLRKHFPHLPGMLSEDWNNEVLAAWGERDDPNSSVFSAFHAADQALREQTVHGDTDRTWGKIDDRADRIDGQWPLM
jgi:hypothetical protein